ncbi:MAG: histidine phosphatase family protein [Oscillospiraceae bacterium]|nr:histidine phosphatase family protein [Oscillospiraceae bacterium]
MIYIIRHGQTELNNLHVLQGRSNYPLNDRGIQQAKSAAEALSGIVFDRVYSSPLTRAIQTAEIIAPYRKAVVDDRLIEMDYGPYEGIDLTRLPPEIITFFSDFIKNPAPDGMEKLSEVVRRSRELIEERCRSLDNILLSTHAIAMKGILEVLTPESQGSYWSKYIGNCSIYAFEFRDGSFTVPKEIYAGAVR